MLLLDEIEKAHTEVFDVLLQLLDDGRLTDGQGRTVDFRNTVVIMTSNLRSPEELRDRFRPEFLNRVDEVVVFEPLTREQLADIVELQLRRLRDRLTERKIELEVTDEAKAVLAEAGWDPAYGAGRSSGRSSGCSRTRSARAPRGAVRRGRHGARRRPRRHARLRARRSGNARRGLSYGASSKNSALPVTGGAP